MEFSSKLVKSDDSLLAEAHYHENACDLHGTQNMTASWSQLWHSLLALPLQNSSIFSSLNFQVTSQIITFEHEGNWSKALEYYDLQIRSVPTLHISGSPYSSKERSRQAEHAFFSKIKNDVMHKKPYKGLIRSLQKVGCSHLLDVYCQGLTSQRGRFQHDLEFIELQVWFNLFFDHSITLSLVHNLSFFVHYLSSMKLLGVWETGISVHFILLLSHQFHIIAAMDNISMKTCTGILLRSCCKYVMVAEVFMHSNPLMSVSFLRLLA